MQNDITVNSLVPLSLVLMTRTIINYSVANNVILVAVFCREKRAIRAYVIPRLAGKPKAIKNLERNLWT